MKILVDANLSPRVADALRSDGHDVEHVDDVGLGAASDPEVLAHARAHGRVVVSSDSDFGTLLARSGDSLPSFVLLRHLNELTPDEQAGLLVECLAAAADHLGKGAVVSIRPGHVRVRPLPLRPAPR